MDEIGEPSRRPDPQPDGADRLEALEHQVRQLMTRMAAWVESQLVQAVEDRRRDLRALRSELQAVIEDRMAAERAESSSMLTVATRRLSVDQEELDARVEDIAVRTGEAVASAAALNLSVRTDAARLDTLEHQLAQRMAWLADSLQAQLIDAADRRRSDLAALRAGLDSALAERLEGVTRLAEQAREGVSVLSLAADAEAARADAFEERLRSATSRLAASLEARLAESASGRLADLEAVRAELLSAVDERVEQGGAASATMVASVEQRVEGLAGQVAQSAEAVSGLIASSESETARAQALEEHLRAALAGVTETVEARLGESAAGRQVELEALRVEVQGVDARLQDVAAQASQAAEGLTALRTSSEADAARAEAFEERVRAVVSRLSESLDTRLAASAGERQAELDILRREVQAMLGDQLAGRVAELVDARLGDVVERRRAELETLHTELQETLSRQLTEARSQIAAAVAGANKRFVRAHEQLTGRMDTVAHTVAGSGEKVDAIAAAVSVQSRRLEALELHARRADDRLAERVGAEVAKLTDLLRTELDGALRAEVGLVRSEMAATTADVDRKLVGTETHVEQRVMDMAEQLASAVTGLEVVRASLAAREGRLDTVEKRARQSEERLAKAVDAQLAESARRRAAELAALSAELTAVVAATSSAEAGPLAPLRSDVRALQDQVGALMAALDDARRPRRRAADRSEGAAAPPPTPAVGARKALGRTNPAPRKATATKAAPTAKRASRATKNGQ